MADPSEAPLQTRIVDDKSPRCIPFILERLEAHLATRPQQPFIIGFNGVQGVGKTTLVKALAATLQQREHLNTLVVSIDDFYLPHTAQLALAAAHPDNALVQVRGEPGTHDVALLASVFGALRRGNAVRIPRYDKAAFDGWGDRVMPEVEEAWSAVNQPGEQPVQVVVLEGWCVGFRSVSHAEIEAKWRAPSRTLGLHKLEDLVFVNDQLKVYDVVTDLFDAFIHIDAEDTEYVYEWRLQQEQQLRKERGTSMTDEQVVKFVDAYYPAYELFSDGVRAGIFPDRKGSQLRLVVGKDRMVIDKIVI
ncbi:unnamed protein product [Discula destructiva]